MSKLVLPPLLPFQDADVRQMQAQEPTRTLLCNEMGTGKTPECLRLIFRKKAYPALIVVPASLRINWRDECRRFIGISPLVLYGVRPNASPAMIRAARVSIIGYDVLHRWEGVLQLAGLKTLIADEARELAGRSSKRSVAFRKLVRPDMNVILADGIPIANYPAELWPLVSCLWPDEFDSDYDFLFRYCSQGEQQRGSYVWRGARNLGSLRERLIRCGYIRRLKRDVLTELPPKRLSVIALPMERPEEYRRAETDFLGWLATWADLVKARSATRALQFAKFSYMKRLTAELKLPAVLDWLRNWLESCGEKIIVAAIHRESKPFVIPTIYERFKELAVQYHGGMTEREKEEAKRRFMQDKDCRMCVLQHKAGGRGLNLQIAQAVAHVELSWNAATHAQITARADRIGQTQSVDEYFLLADAPIERKLCQMIQEKSGMTDRLLDGKRQTVNTLNLFDRLTIELLKIRKGVQT